MSENKATIIKQLEVELLQPDVRKNPRRLMELLADDFFELGASGMYLDKEWVVRELPKLPEAKWSVHDANVKELASDVVLITYKAEKRDITSGDIQWSWRSSLWRYKNEEWHMVFHQGTPMS